MKPNRKDLRKVKSIHTDLRNVMAKISGLEPETEKAIREETYQLEAVRVKIEQLLITLYSPL